jgi:hypothetical protein
MFAKLMKENFLPTEKIDYTVPVNFLSLL